MKKTVLKSLLAKISAGVLWFGMVFAASGDLQSLIGNITDDVLFGYDENSQITVKEVTSTKVVIETPILKDELWDVITKYYLTYWPYSLDELLNNPRADELMSQFSDKLVTTNLTNWTLTIQLTSTWDNLDPNKKMYLVIIPKDQYDMPGSMSNEVWFQLSSQTKWDTSDIVSQTTTIATNNTWSMATWAIHGSAVDMTLANITHLQEGNKLTLKWTAIEWSEKVDIYNYNPTTKVYEKLSTVNMDDEKYSYTISRNWEHQVKFIPTDGKEKVYMFTVTWISEPKVTPPSSPDKPKPEIKKVPKVGPKENVMVAIILSSLLYVLYRRSYRKVK